jgi:hypothetical protein
MLHRGATIPLEQGVASAQCFEARSPNSARIPVPLAQKPGCRQSDSGGPSIVVVEDNLSAQPGVLAVRY